MSPPRHASLWDRLTEAALAYADADTVDDGRDFLRARDRLRKAAIAYGLSTEAGRRAAGRRRVVVSVANQMAFWPRTLL